MKKHRRNCAGKEEQQRGMDMFQEPFEIRIDASDCISLVEGGATLEKKTIYEVNDAWRYEDVQLESGKIYGVVGEYRQGPMYLSYLLGGEIEFGNLKIFCNEKELSRTDLEQVSWNLEPLTQKYKNYTVKKSIEKAIKAHNIKEDFNEIAQKFILTEPRYDRKLFHLTEKIFSPE